MEMVIFAVRGHIVRIVHMLRICTYVYLLHVYIIGQ